MAKSKAAGVLTPAASVLAKLGSIVVHAEEFLSSSGHKFDLEALHSLVNDPEARAWLSGMDALAMIPKKR